MKRKKTPQEKKRLSYENDYPVCAEYPHAFRKNWPRKKAKMNRHLRRWVGQLLHEAAIKAAAGAGDLESEVVTRRVIHKATNLNKARKWKPVSLRESVEGSLERRAETVAWNYFKEPYRSEKHRARFAKVLESIIEGRGLHSKCIAAFFKEVLQREHGGGIWLKEFFKDEPQWETRLRNWIERIKISNDDND